MSIRMRPAALWLLAGLIEAALLLASRPGAALDSRIWLSVAGLFYLIAAVIVLGWKQLGPVLRFRWIVLAAVVFRLTLLPLAPHGPQAVRAGWEGEILHDGFNPYVFAPNHSVFAPIVTAGVKALPEAGVASFHPPLAEALYHWSWAWSRGPRSRKILFVVFDLLLILLLGRILAKRGRPREWALLYAWSPLAVWAIAGQGHIESVAGLLLLLALVLVERYPSWAGIAGGAAAMTQWYTLLLAPALVASARQRAGPRASQRWARTLGWGVGIVVLVWVPFAFYLRRFVVPMALHNVSAHLALPAFNASVYALLAAWFGANAGRMVVCLAAAAVGVGFRGTEPLWAAHILIGAVLLLSPWMHPWMVLWVLPFVALFPDGGTVTWFAWLYFSVAVLWAGVPHAVWAEYVPLYAMLAWQAWQSPKRHAGVPLRPVGA